MTFSLTSEMYVLWFRYEYQIGEWIGINVEFDDRKNVKITKIQKQKNKKKPFEYSS